MALHFTFMEEGKAIRHELDRRGIFWYKLQYYHVNCIEEYVKYSP